MAYPHASSVAGLHTPVKSEEDFYERCYACEGVVSEECLRQPTIVAPHCLPISDLRRDPCTQITNTSESANPVTFRRNGLSTCKTNKPKEEDNRSSTAEHDSVDEKNFKPGHPTVSPSQCYNSKSVAVSTDSSRRLKNSSCKEVDFTSSSLITSDIIFEGGVYAKIKKDRTNMEKISSLEHSNSAVRQSIEPANWADSVNNLTPKPNNISEDWQRKLLKSRENTCSDSETKHDNNHNEEKPCNDEYLDINCLARRRGKTNEDNTKSESEPICVDYESKPDKINFSASYNACSSCGKTFSTSYALKVHDRIHTGERPYVCSVCRKSFTQSNTLKVHERIHSGERPYPCSICKKAFIQRSDLTKHIRIHSGERPFACSECNKSFSASNDLAKHERVHCKKRLFACSFCDKTFSFDSQLKAHRPIHCGKRPYVCSVCCKTFLSNSNLKTHERVHNQEPESTKSKSLTISFSSQSFSPDNDPTSLPIELCNMPQSAGIKCVNVPPPRVSNNGSTCVVLTDRSGWRVTSRSIKTVDRFPRILRIISNGSTPSQFFTSTPSVKKIE